MARRFGSCETASRWFSMCCGSVWRSGRCLLLLQIVPADQAVLRDRTLCRPADDLDELTRGNAGAGALHPHVFLPDRRPGRDIADGDDAVERHVADVLFA